MNLDASELSGIEKDALAEIGNIGVNRAAASLRQMVGEQVLLSVPAPPGSRNEARRSWLRCSNHLKGRFPGGLF